MTLVGKCLPKEITGADGAPLIGPTVIEIVAANVGQSED